MGNEERRARMRKAMEAQGLDALVLRLPENVLLLSGHWPMIGIAYLVFPLEGKATCILPACYRNEAEASLEDCEAKFLPYGGKSDPPYVPAVRAAVEQAVAKSARRIGYEGNFEVVAPSWNLGDGMVPAADTMDMLRAAFADRELMDVSALLKKERLRKTPYEIERMAIASEISCFAMEAFQDAAEVGVSGVELVAITEHAATIRGTGYKGTVRVRALAQVTTGAAETAEGHRPNVISTVREMQDGDFAMLELGLVADGYWADRTRVRIVGTARDEQIKIFETVKKAQEAAIASIRAGVRARDVDAAARAVIEDAGYGREFPHITGHGLGFGYHEASPILGPLSHDVLEEGMMTSVEPGIYTAKFGGCRIEDDVIVTNDGSLVLGPYKKRWN
jgi:Xaa-Pro aminopeptidase